MALAVAACGGSDAADDTADDGGELVIDGGAAVVVDGTEGGELVVDAEIVADATGTDAGASELDADGATAENGPDELSDEERALAFAECMRDEGIDWPDPTTNADGSIDPLGGRLLRDLAGTDEAATQAAGETCSPLLEGASFLPNGGSGFDAETQDAFLDFAECLRGEGLDVDDPDFGGGAGPGAIGGLFGDDFDPNDPDNQAAIDACSALFAGGPLGGQGG